MQTQNNGVGFTLWIRNEADIELLKFPIGSYLNSEQFNLHIENHEWIFVDDDFHVTLFFTRPHGFLSDIAIYTSYKRTGLSTWERRE
ncbi:MAG: hypothetical protein FWC36_05930 [Spirochaetes bacterium]|nr:hypothetical protein [Spirochaetota bacterium]